MQTPMETVMVKDMQTGREVQGEVVTTNVADHPELMQQPAWVQPGGWVHIQGPQEQASGLPPTPGTPLNQDLFDLGSASPSRSPIEDWREALEIAHRRTPAPCSDFEITPQLEEGMRVTNLEQELERTKQELCEAKQVILEHQSLEQSANEQQQYIQELLQKRHEVATENQLRFEQLEQQHQLQIQQLEQQHQLQLQQLKEAHQAQLQQVEEAHPAQLQAKPKAKRKRKADAEVLLVEGIPVHIRPITVTNLDGFQRVWRQRRAIRAQSQQLKEAHQAQLKAAEELAMRRELLK